MAKGLWTVLNVDNVEKSAEFYKSLGIKTRVESIDVPGVPSAPMGTVDLGDNCGFMLWDKHVVPADQPADTRAWVSGELGKGVMLSVGVPNAKKVWANAQKIRAEVEQPLSSQPWGGSEFTIIDIDGYVLNVTDKFPKASRAKPKRAAKRAVKKAKKVARKVTRR